MKNLKDVYVVSYQDDLEDEPVVTVFDNKLAAIKCFKTFSKIHDKVVIDEVPLYSKFISDTKLTNEGEYRDCTDCVLDLIR